MHAQTDPGTGQDFDLRSSLVVLRRRYKTIIVVVVLVVAVGALLSYRKQPVYEATATALLRPGAADSVLTEQLSNDPERRVQNEAVLITSAATEAEVRDRIGDAGGVSVAAGGRDDVLEITATAGDPEKAALLANTYAEAHRDLRSEGNRQVLANAKRQVQESLSDTEAESQANARAIRQLQDTQAVTLDPAVFAQLDQQISEKQQLQQNLTNAASAYSEQLGELETQEGLITSRPPIEILTPAGVPGAPVSPNHRQDLTMVLVLALLLGIAVVFVQENLDDTIRDLADLSAAAPGLASLAVIPHQGEGDEWAIRTATRPMSHTAEAFRSLRTSLEFLALENRMRTIQVTSAQAGEGKTTCVVNLAVAFAQAGESVVLVDCDLRRPRLHRYFGLDRHIGFTSVLLRERTLADVVRTAPAFPNLSVLCAGPLTPNPSELLGSSGFAEMIRDLADDHSVILLDSPPVLPVTDATVLSRLVDATVMLASSGTSRKRRVRRAVDSLRQVGAPLVGTVLTSAPHEVAYGYVDYGYIGYGPVAEPRDGNGPLGRSRSRTETNR